MKRNMYFLMVLIMFFCIQGILTAADEDTTKTLGTLNSGSVKYESKTGTTSLKVKVLDYYLFLAGDPVYLDRLFTLKNQNSTDLDALKRIEEWMKKENSLESKKNKINFLSTECQELSGLKGKKDIRKELKNQIKVYEKQKSDDQKKDRIKTRESIISSLGFITNSELDILEAEIEALKPGSDSQKLQQLDVLITSANTELNNKIDETVKKFEEEIQNLKNEAADIETSDFQNLRDEYESLKKKYNITKQEDIEKNRTEINNTADKLTLYKKDMDDNCVFIPFRIYFRQRLEDDITTKDNAYNLNYDLLDPTGGLVTVELYRIQMIYRLLPDCLLRYKCGMLIRSFMSANQIRFVPSLTGSWLQLKDDDLDIENDVFIGRINFDLLGTTRIINETFSSDAGKIELNAGATYGVFNKKKTEQVFETVQNEKPSGDYISLRLGGKIDVKDEVSLSVQAEWPFMNKPLEKVISYSFTLSSF